MTQRALAMTLGLSLSLSLMPGTARGEVLEREFHESFAIAPGARLELIHGDGDVSLRPWDRDVIDVQVRYKAEFRGLGLATEPDFEVDFERKGETILVQGREIGSMGIGFFLNRERDYVYTIQAPDWVVLDTSGDDGDVDIEGWRGNIDCVLDDGDLTLADVRAKTTRLEAEDGDIEIDGFEGALEIRVDDGDVDIRECSSDELQIRAADGDVSLVRCSGNFKLMVDDGGVVVDRADVSKLEIRSSDGDVDVALLSATDLDLEIEVEDGDVTLELGPEISATYTIETDDGSIRLSRGDAARSERADRVTGKIGDGAGRIRITTTDGNVILR
ncbi:MAG: DUF4097 domain-containing protein [bacterium]|nr:DUF4097 domain-containing protein [bacterium]